MVFRRRRVMRRRFNRKRRNVSALTLAKHKRRKRTNYRLKPTNAISKFGSGLPDTFTIKYKYHVGMNMQSSVTQGAVKQFYGNIPYDPDPVLGGNSALDYQTLISAYNFNRCYASKIIVRGTIINNNPLSVVVTPFGDITAREFDVVCADKRAKVGRMVANQGTTSFTIVNFCTTKAIFGLKTPIDDNDHNYDMNHITNTKPIEKWYWIIQSQLATGFATNFNLSMEIDIIYYTRWIERAYPVNMATVTDDEEEVGITGAFPDRDDIVVNPS